MEINIKDWIMDYGVIAHKRFYRKEKIRFIKRIEQDFHQMGYKTCILSPQGSKGKAVNLLIGDVKTAKNIVLAYYDTPAKSFGLYSHKPFDLRYRKIWYLGITAIPLIFITIICFLFSIYFLKIEWLKGIYHVHDIWAFLVYITGIILIVQYARGIPNGRNLNRNSSGVVALLKIAKDCTDKQRTTTAFVLTDYGCINNFGDQMIKAYMTHYDTANFILLDCIGKADVNAVCYSPSISLQISKLDKRIVRFPMDHDNNAAQLYPRTLIISSGTLQNNTLVCPNVNTRKDMDIDTAQILYIAKQIRNLL